MSITESSKILNPTSDGLFDLRKQRAFVNTDVLARASNTIVAVEGGTGSIASPLNNPQGAKTTTLKIFDNASSKIRWDTVAIRVRMVIYARGSEAAPATAPNYGSNVPWNLLPKLLSRVSVQVNEATGAGNFFTSTDGHASEEITARLLMNHSWQELQEMDQTLFTPFGKEEYTVATNAKAANDNAFNGIVKDDALKRYHKYCHGALNTQTIEIVKLINLNDLCGFPPGITQNIKQMTIELRWTPSTALLDYYTTAEADQARVACVGADALVDCYLPTGSKMVSNALLKEPTSDPDLDILPYLQTEYHKLFYNGSGDLLVPNVKSFYGMLLWVDALGNHNNNATANDRRTYTSHGQFCFGEDAKTTTNTIKPKAFYPEGVPVGSEIGFKSFQMNYHSQDFPSQKMVLYRTSVNVECPDFSQAYYEYQKMCNRFGRKDLSTSIPYDVFKSTMPFIAVCPNASVPKPPGDAGDVLIRLEGGTNCTIHCIMLCYKVATVAPSGVLTMY